MPVWNSIPRTWATGEKITAALLNANLRDPLLALGGQWNTYTPQFDQGVTNIAKTVIYAKYNQFGKLVRCNVRLDITGAGTSGQIMVAALPVAAAVGGLVTGMGTFVDANGSIYHASAFLQNTTSVAVYGVGATIAAASGDVFAISIAYEAA